jgi:hypothetical protein
MIQGLLLAEGIPSLIKRTRGFDLPDFLAAGPRDIFVRASRAGAAREVLTGSAVDSRPSSVSVANPLHIAVGLLVAVLIVALVVVFGLGL